MVEYKRTLDGRGRGHLHTIVYLDQSFLSNMAKAQNGYIRDKEQAKFWNSLFNDLKKAVLSNKTSCPCSEFQEIETRFDKRIEKSVTKIIDELSWGLQFHSWESILQSQIEDAARRFLGKQPEKREPWAIAFLSDPQANVESRMEEIFGIKARMNVHLYLPDDITEDDRQIKLGFVDTVQELLKKHVNNSPEDLPKALVESKKSFVTGYMGNLAWLQIAQQLQRYSPFDQLNALDRIDRLTNLWNRLHEVGINIYDKNMVMCFAESDEFLNSPFIDIYGSIFAVIATHYAKRKIKQGDFYDVPILATVLPYCDVVTTDAFMKEILVQILHFDNKYKVKILSSTDRDRLAFQKLIGLLLDK